MSIAPVSTTGQTSSAGKTAGNALAASSDVFLKLLVTNLQHQDPLQPTDSSAFMEQLSQMTMVEKITSLSDAAAATNESQQASASIGLIGRTVTYLDADGNPVEGVVQSVDVSGKRPALTVGGATGVDPATITEVR